MGFLDKYSDFFWIFRFFFKYLGQAQSKTLGFSGYNISAPSPDPWNGGNLKVYYQELHDRLLTAMRESEGSRVQNS